MNAQPSCVVLLADIHANEAALLAVIRDARARYRACEPLAFWCLGDIFGRGPDGAGAWQRLMDLAPAAVVAGNHDWGLCGRTANVWVEDRWTGEFNAPDWQVLLDQRKELGWLGLLQDKGPRAGGPVGRYLCGLPVVSAPRAGMFLVHGGLQNPAAGSDSADTLAFRLVWEYVTGPVQAAWTLAALQALVAGELQLPPADWQGDRSAPPTAVILGHNHRRFFGRLGRAGEWLDPPPLDQALAWQADPAQPVLISPGSVGFSRMRGSRAACYAALKCTDEGTCAVMFHEVAYERDGVQSAMRGLGRPERIIQLLDLPGGGSGTDAADPTA